VDLSVFYAAMAGIAFTLTGIWWYVVAANPEWSSRSERRLLAYVVGMSFMLPGAMSLLSIIAPDQPMLWRATFAVAGILGLASVLLVLRTLREDHDTPVVVKAFQVLLVPLYAIVALIALFPEIPANLGLTLKGIQVEAIANTLVVLFGAQCAFILTLEPRRTRD